MFAQLDLTINPYSQQKEWRHLILFAFFLGGLGTGTFMIATVLGLVPGAIVGYLLTVVGKNCCHMLFLGRPERFWRMAMRPGTSWISRGFWGIVVFAVSGLFVLLHQMGWLPLGTAAYWTLLALSFASGFWVMLYTGFVMSASPSIPAWNSTLVPLLFVLYGFLGGLDIVLIILGLQGGQAAGLPVAVATLELWELGLLLLALFLTIVYVAVMNTGSRTTREAARRLLRGELFGIFVIGVVVVGLVLPVLFMLVGLLQGGVTPMVMVLTGVLALAGSLLFRWALLRVGLYSPLM